MPLTATVGREKPNLLTVERYRLVRRFKESVEAQ